MWGANNRDMLLYRKSRLWGCYKPRHVTKGDMLVLATLRYLTWLKNITIDVMKQSLKQTPPTTVEKNF